MGTSLRKKKIGIMHNSYNAASNFSTANGTSGFLGYLWKNMSSSQQQTSTQSSSVHGDRTTAAVAQTTTTTIIAATTTKTVEIQDASQDKSWFRPKNSQQRHLATAKENKGKA